MGRASEGMFCGMKRALATTAYGNGRSEGCCGALHLGFFFLCWTTKILVLCTRAVQVSCSSQWFRRAESKFKACLRRQLTGCDHRLFSFFAVLRLSGNPHSVPDGTTFFIKAGCYRYYVSTRLEVLVDGLSLSPFGTEYR